MEWATFWFGTKLNHLHEFSLLSFVTQVPKVVLYSFDKAISVPPEVEVRDASDIYPADLVFENPRQKGSFAGFSDIFRYELMRQTHSTWFDLDVICWNWNEDGRDYLFGYESEQEIINGAVLRLPLGSSLATELSQRSQRVPPKKVRWGDLGPKLLTKVISSHDLRNQAQPKNAFYHLSPAEIWKFFDPASSDELKKELNHSKSVHLWNEVLRFAAPELKAKRPAESSLAGELYSDLNVSQLEPLPASWARTVLRKRLGNHNSFSSRLSRRLRSTMRR